MPASIDSLIRAPSAAMRSSVDEPAPSRPTEMWSDAAPSDAVSRWPTSVSRSLRLEPAELRSAATPSWAVAIASRTRVPLVTIDSR